MHSHPLFVKDFSEYCEAESVALEKIENSLSCSNLTKHDLVATNSSCSMKHALSERDPGTSLI
jgi:hypothetical protein